MVSVKEHGVLIPRLKLACLIEAGRFFLFIYVVDYGRGNIFCSGKKNIHFFFFGSTETALGGKRSLERLRNRKLVIRNLRGINAKDLG